MFRGWRRKLILFIVVFLAFTYFKNNPPTGWATSSGSGEVSTAAIPPDYLAHYKAAGDTCPSLDWTLLAGVGQIETHHGRLNADGVTSGANYAGAMGPMQFLKPTFNSVRAKHPDVGPNIYSPADSIRAAAYYLCDSGLAAGNKTKALWAYNHSDKYRRDVLDAAAGYASAGL